MNDFTLATRSSHLGLTNSANSTTAGTSIANPADTQSTPTGDGVLGFGTGGSVAANGLLLIPYGVGSATNTFLMSVFAWDVIQGSQPTTKNTWTAWLLASFTCTLSASSTGMAPVSGAANFVTGELYCDTITISAGNANVSAEAVSPTGSVKASVVLDVKGCRLVEVRFAMNGSSTSANALWRRL